MAFVTRSPVTQYDNAGRHEMYRYNARHARTGLCVLHPERRQRRPLTSKPAADGLFMTDDGRTFFATEDPLVHADTNRAQDVYEYVEGGRS